MKLTDTTAAALKKLCDVTSMPTPGKSWVALLDVIESDSACQDVIDAGLFRVISASQGELTERGADALRAYDAERQQHTAPILTESEAAMLAAVAERNDIAGGARGLIRAALNEWMTGLGDRVVGESCPTT